VEILGNASRGTVLSTDETMSYWTSLGNCSEPQSEKLADTNPEDESHIIKTSWNCQGSPQAINYQIVNGGHTIPHPKSQFPKLLGVSNQDMNAPRAIWDFFKAIREARQKQEEMEEQIESGESASL